LQLWLALRVLGDELDEAFHRLNLLTFTIVALWVVTSVDAVNVEYNCSFAVALSGTGCDHLVRRFDRERRWNSMRRLKYRPMRVNR
jgi:predicted choloylglycine hydrolase